MQPPALLGIVTDRVGSTNRQQTDRRGHRKVTLAAINTPPLSCCFVYLAVLPDVVADLEVGGENLLGLLVNLNLEKDIKSVDDVGML